MDIPKESAGTSNLYLITLFELLYLSYSYSSYVPPLNIKLNFTIRQNKTKKPNGSLYLLDVTSTYISIFPATLPTVHRFSRIDIKVNFDRRNTKMVRLNFNTMSMLLTDTIVN